MGRLRLGQCVSTWRLWMGSHPSCNRDFRGLQISQKTYLVCWKIWPGDFIPNLTDLFSYSVVLKIKYASSGRWGNLGWGDSLHWRLWDSQTVGFPAQLLWWEKGGWRKTKIEVCYLHQCHSTRNWICVGFLFKIHWSGVAFKGSAIIGVGDNWQLSAPRVASKKLARKAGWQFLLLATFGGSPVLSSSLRQWRRAWLQNVVK